MSVPLNRDDLRRLGYELKGDGSVARIGDAQARPHSKPILESWTDGEGRVNYRFTLYGAPRTKKTSNQASRTGKHCPKCKLGTGMVRVFPSAQFRKWQEECASYVSTKPELNLALSKPLGMCALVYRDRASGDFVGYMQGISDVLQHVGIVLNDRYIVHHDGSRLRRDPNNPRVEITLTILSEQPELTERGE